MKDETMIDLSKLPWDELKLPDFNGWKVRADCAMTGNFACIEGDGYYPIATQRKDWPGRWEYRSCTVDEIEQIAKMCRAVEEFIKKHGG